METWNGNMETWQCSILKPQACKHTHKMPQFLCQTMIFLRILSEDMSACLHGWLKASISWFKRLNLGALPVAKAFRGHRPWHQRSKVHGRQAKSFDVTD
jgi:hypothetical protein